MPGASADSAVSEIGIVIGADGVIYSKGRQGLYAINPDGTVKWHFKEDVSSSPVIAEDGTIYVAGGNNRFLAINPDGTKKWEFKGRARSGFYFFTTPAIDKDGTIIVAHDEDRVYAINPDGTERWSTDLAPSEINRKCTPVIDKDGYIFILGDYHLFELYPDGTKRGMYSGNRGYNLPVISKDGTIYYTGKKEIVAIDSSRKILFRKDIETDFDLPMVIGRDGTLYFANYRNGKLYAYSSEGLKKWEFQVEGNIKRILTTPIIGANDIIYFGGEDGKVYALDKDGKKVWSYETEGSVFSSPAIGADGTIYIGAGTNGSLLAIGEKTEQSVTRPKPAKAASNNYTEENNQINTKDGKIEGDVVVWNSNKVLGQNGNYPFAGIYDFNNLTIGDNVEITSTGISQLVLRVRGTLTMGKNASIRVRNGYYPEAPKVQISSINESNMADKGEDAGGFLVFPQIYGKGGNGGDGGSGGDGESKVETELDIKIGGKAGTPGRMDHKFTFMQSGNGGGGGFGGGKGGKGGAAGKENGGGRNAYPGEPGEDNGGDGGSGNVSSSKTGGIGGKGTDLGKNALDDNTENCGGGGGGGNGGNGKPGDAGDNKYTAGGGSGGGAGGYGGGILTIIADNIQYDNQKPPHFIVSGQQGGLNGSGGERAENGQGGMLIIQCPNYSESAKHWELGNNIWGTHFVPSKNGGHGVVTGNPQKVFINKKPIEFKNSINSQADIGDLKDKRLDDAVVLYVGSPKALAMGKMVYCDSSNKDVSPIVLDGSTLVPVRFISENFGAEIGWDSNESAVTIGVNKKMAKLKIGSNKMQVNDNEIQLEVPAQIINERTFVPLRRLVEDVLGKKIFYDRNVIIISDREDILCKVDDKKEIDTIIQVLRH